MITATGLGSGLDIESLVTQLVAAERQRPEQRLNQNEAQAQAELSAFGILKSAVSSFQSTTASLDSSTFWSKLSSSSNDENVIGVSLGTGADVGSYSIEVGQLARSHALASTAFANSTTTELGAGTLTINFGTTDYDTDTDTYNSFTANSERDSLSISIDSTNNTLQGIRDAINDAEGGVSATIINDGSGYRLLLSSEFTGAENSLEIVATDDDGNSLDSSGLSALSFNIGASNLQQTIAATDANLTINGLAITSDSNTLSDTLDGVTLNLQQVSTGPTQISIERDLTAIETGVRTMVEEYNKLQATLGAISGYDANTQQAGILNGDFTTRAVSDRINSILRSALGGTAEIQSLSQLGIRTQSDGTLAIEGDALKDALRDNLQGVRSLFTAAGTATDSSVTYLGKSKETRAGDYAIEITQLATSSLLVGAGVLPAFGGGGSLTIDADNDEFSIDVDGLGSTAITLAQGIYTDGNTLAADIENAINNSALLALGGQVDVSYNAAGNTLEISSVRAGSKSSIEITSVDVNSAVTLGLGVGIGSTGLDVGGTIGGEPASGEGNILTAAVGSNAEGLQLLIGPGAPGSRGTVTFSRGLANQLDVLLDDYLASDGLLQNRSDGLQDRVDDMDEQREALERRLEAIETRYRTQFAGLDILLAQLQSTSEYLTQQLANLPEPNSINRRS